MKHYLVFLFAALLLFSCDSHESLDYHISVGDILCDDGRIVSPVAYADGGVRGVGVVFAPRTESHEVLVVLLDELSSVTFCDSLGLSLGTSCDLEAFDGYVNTTSMQNVGLGRSPLASSAFSSHCFHQSDFIPSVAEMGLLYLSRGVVNPVLRSLGGTELSFASDHGGCWYWTSTEVKENQGRQAWLFSMADGSRHKAPVVNAYRARLVIEYNPLNVQP